jgi:hypothetical protein
MNIRLSNKSKARPHRIPHRLNPANLSRSKVVVASIRRVIHVVVDSIDARLVRTAILGRLRRAAVRALTLRRGVVDEVSVSIARVTFEGVQESKPVARLVDRSAALAVAANVTAGHSAGGDVAAVGDVDGGRSAGGDFRREGARSENAACEVGVEV